MLQRAICVFTLYVLIGQFEFDSEYKYNFLIFVYKVKTAGLQSKNAQTLDLLKMSLFRGKVSTIYRFLVPEWYDFHFLLVDGSIEFSDI